MSARLIWFSRDSKAFQYHSSSKLSDPCSCFILVLVDVLLWHRSMILRIASVITGLSLIFHFFKKTLKKFREEISGTKNSDWQAMAVLYDIACQA